MKKNKKVWIIVASVIAVVSIAIVGLYQYGKTLMPYYNNTSKNIVLVSNKENKLTDEQIDEFYNIARGALTSHNKDLNFTNLDDYSLYVEKLKGEKGKYLINYICENPTTKLRFENKIEVVLQNDKIGSDDNFLYEILKSDLLEFVGSPIKNSVNTSTIGTAETTSSSDSSNSHKAKNEVEQQSNNSEETENNSIPQWKKDSDEAKKGSPIGTILKIPNLEVTLVNANYTEERNQFEDPAENVLEVVFNIKNTSPAGTSNHQASFNNITVVDSNGKVAKTYALDNDIQTIEPGQSADIKATFSIESKGDLEIYYYLPSSRNDRAVYKINP